MSLKAISPIDGRYLKQTQELSKYFSEEALIKYRIVVEIEYFIALCQIPLSQLADLDSKYFEILRDIYRNFSTEQAVEIKNIEAETSHDVKAVEYFLKKEFDAIGLGRYKEFIHFALTSQDINNTAIPMMLKDAVKEVYLPSIEKLICELDFFAFQWQDVPMLARTHGQVATPVRLGKEFKVFSVRIKKQLEQLKNIEFSAKFAGATGGYNAHLVSFPEIDWLSFSKNFIEQTLGLTHSFPTTQIEHYDNLASLFDAVKRINVIAIDLCRDIWQYISMDYFKQKANAKEVGSSAMPHKVNPIDFENAEGNFAISNAFLEFLSSKLPISRLQRDLTDSTTLRNVGVPFAHINIAIKSLEKGLGKLFLNQEKLKTDLQDNWVVVSEAIQTILRRENYPAPYEKLKALTRAKGGITQKVMIEFIDSLDVTESVKKELKSITPENYIGIKVK